VFRKVKVVIGQLGSPKTPDPKDVRPYLKEFLGDPRVVDINPLLWKIILNLFVLPFRPKKSGEAYGRIWDGKSFPLIENTKHFAQAVEKHLDDNIELDYAFLLSPPRVNDILDCWEQADFGTRADRVVILPQFPQYSESTTASVVDTVGGSFAGRVNIPSFDFLSNYHRLKAFIDHSATKVQESLDKKKPDALVISFHGIPLRRVTQKKDEYYQHCFETFELIKKKIDFPEDKVHLCFQSRFGSEQWLGPATDEYCEELVEKGNKHIAVYCPSFVVDCLETTDEIGHELHEDVVAAGGELTFIECLNDDPEWAKDYAHFINTYVNGNKKELDELFYPVDYHQMQENLPPQVHKSPPLSNHAKSSIKLIFLTLFLDLVGFSIIFPMFPALAKYYLEVDPNNVFLKAIFGTIEGFTNMGGVNMNSIVLFGGALGALYALLQFIAAPIWGSLSDRMGRKPVLMVSIFGLMVSYILWIFSGSFTLLILARFIGGIMGGNLSVATAVVADVTDQSNRSKGMAFVGIAFAFGFIFGPALGGALSLIDLSTLYPQLQAYGINPFSVPAILASVLSLFNLIFIARRFKETLPPEKRNLSSSERSANPLKIFRPLPFPMVNRTNWAYFVFITAFSGMEFTLTFLAVERLGYTSMDNAYMFIFIGFIIALVQGGYVRRKANQVGEKSMAMKGLMTIVPGLIIIAYTQNSYMLYLGLFFLAVGSAMAIPTLTSLVSIFTPAQEQGRSLGIFRSLGSLGRVVGPIAASLVYWKYGSVFPYIAGALSIGIPLMILTKVVQDKEPKEATLQQQ
jgi:ferrochelatase